MEGAHAVFNVGFQLINGMMLGIEFPGIPDLEDLDEDDPEVTFAIIFDLLIFRMVVYKIKVE